MRADIEAAVRIARQAADFDWAWTIDNLEQFCGLVGWQRPVPDEIVGAEIQTDLNISWPVALAVYDPKFCRIWLPGSQVVYVTVCLTDDPSEDSLEVQQALVDRFAEIYRRISSELGKPARLLGRHPRVYWDLPKVSLVLTADFDRLEVSFRIANSIYQHHDNLIYEDDEDREEVSPTVIARPSGSDWPEFAASLALALSRLPEGGDLQLSMGDTIGAQFTMRHIEGLRCGSARRGWIIGFPNASTGSRKGIEWPAANEVFLEMAENLTAELREAYQVVTPSEILAEAWVDSYRCIPDISTIGETEQVDR
ncbi:DUF6301 family protein [Nocardia sp. NPDC051030]|uniref:DUF6301 family protein n=1 Tax=Nocardia sp. NPDC051030 TaxID=3155162 RepID=UPI0034128D83